jgi:hypothetical protein
MLGIELVEFRDPPTPLIIETNWDVMNCPKQQQHDFDSFTVLDLSKVQTPNQRAVNSWSRAKEPYTETLAKKPNSKLRQAFQG